MAAFRAMQVRSVMLQSSKAEASEYEQAIAEAKAAIIAKMTLSVGKDPGYATDRDWFVATALAARDRVTHRFLGGKRVSKADGKKRVYYLSLEFLIGRQLTDVLF